MAAEETSSDIIPTYMSELTEEQQQFLNELEAEFANRYTDDDPEYVQQRDAGPPPPPIVDPWYNKPRRNFDWTRQHGNSGRRHQNWGGRNERHEGGGSQHHRQGERYQQRHKPY